MFVCTEAFTDAWALLISNLIMFEASLNYYIPRCCNSILQIIKKKCVQLI